ncbi:hypothetical protein BLNAU_1406 [Blattamonas nauphoetae]|uniref:B30.2/SPRY domain-containing protein n=1 Tax=Blattamonas nauphoetae TaxID=2049346 RepID=A0ABQ9YJB7_9EUKA|nr:hypothetical protein BLNAU_1406 [Blattamonas nauphoetae]
MFGDINQHDSLFDSPTSTKPLSIESVLDEFSSSGSNVSAIVNTPNWNHIPLLIRDWDGKDETPMLRLLDELSRILTLVSDSDIPLANKRLLHLSLSNLSKSPTLPKKIRTRVDKCVPTLNSIADGPFMMMETEEFRTMQHALTDRVAQAEEKTRQAEEAKRLAEEKEKMIEEQNGHSEREKEKLSDEVKRTAKELGEAREEKTKSEREITTLKSKNDELELQLADLPIWVGTDSLQTLDRTSHRLTPTTLTQIVKLEGITDWRTAFTFPIDEGEWELKIRRSEQTGLSVTLGYIRHPLPEDARQNGCGCYLSGIGGDFVLWDGRLWHAAKEFKPAGTNKKCDRIGQTAAIRVNMTTREARLFVDDEEQPGIFTDIPSPLCLAISTSKSMTDSPVEVLWLKRRRS